MSSNGHMTAAIYARLSSEKKGLLEEDEKSTALQIKQARQYAEQQKFPVSEDLIWEDGDNSGREFERRPGLQALLESLTPAPPFRHLIIRDLDRLSREQFEGGMILKRLAKAGVTIHEYRTGPVALDSALQRFMVTAKGLSAEMEAEQAGKRVREKFEDKARRGLATCGNVGFGYRRHDVRVNGVRQYVEIQVDEPEAEIVRRIFHLAGQGATPRQIAHQLNEEHVAGPQGRPWRGSLIYQMITRSIYKGTREWGRRKARDAFGSQSFKPRPRSEWLVAEVPHLRIVTDEAWEKAQDAIRNRPTPPAFSGYHGPSKHVLAGFAVCGLCGGPLIVTNRKQKEGRARFYRCGRYHQGGTRACSNNSVKPMIATDAAVLRALQAVALSPETMDACLSAYAQDRPGKGRSRKQIDREIAQAEKQVGNLTEAITLGGDLPTLVSRLQEAQGRLEALRRERPAGSPRPPIVDQLPELREEFKKRLHLFGLFAGHHYDPARARGVLKVVLVGKLSFSPAEGGAWAFEGKVGFSYLLKGLVPGSKLFASSGMH